MNARQRRHRGARGHCFLGRRELTHEAGMLLPPARGVLDVVGRVLKGRGHGGVKNLLFLAATVLAATPGVKGLESADDALLSLSYVSDSGTWEALRGIRCVDLDVLVHGADYTVSGDLETDDRHRSRLKKRLTPLVEEFAESELFEMGVRPDVPCEGKLSLEVDFLDGGVCGDVRIVYVRLRYYEILPLAVGRPRKWESFTFVTLWEGSIAGLVSTARVKEGVEELVDMALSRMRVEVKKGQCEDPGRFGCPKEGDSADSR